LLYNEHYQGKTVSSQYLKGIRLAASPFFGYTPGMMKLCLMSLPRQPYPTLRAVVHTLMNQVETLQVADQ
jgi:hypothetical protein